VVSHIHAPAAAPDTITVDQREAERLSGVSYKTLERLASAGEAVGRVRIGRRVLFVRDVLEAYIRAQLSTTRS
jgi:hypothetical protein